MKLFKKALKSTLILSIVAFSIIACDKDFASIDSDIINEETATNFNTTSEQYNVISYTDALGPVQSDAFGINLLGIYNDPIYGKTTSNFVTQLNTSIIDPSFGENPVLDSVVLSIPFFSTNIGAGTSGQVQYDLDSILPKKVNNNYEPIRLNIYENNYFLRDFDPNGDFDDPQRYYSNRSTSSNEIISQSSLQGALIHVENELDITNEQIVLLDNDGLVTQTLPPGIRIKLDRTFWQQKIFDQEGEAVLSNANNFGDYFRGLYFEAEDNLGESSLMLLNLSQSEANITMYYTRDPFTEGQDRVQTTFALNFGPNRVNFFENEFTNQINDGDEIEGDTRLYLKGGEGSIASISLFNGENVDDDNNSDNSFETWRKQFVNLDADGNFESSKRLINEANLVFYVDQEIVNGEEPNRLYLYDKTNNSPLIDYFLDTQNNTLASVSIPNHLGILERDSETNEGVRYKMRVTGHINNILFNNIENIELGLSVSGNVNLEGTVPQRIEQTLDGSEKSVPISSLITPRGTVLHGNMSEDTNKRVYLEIFYTCLETDLDCPENN